MIISMSIHHPNAGAEAALIDSMHRFGNAIKGAPGLVAVYTLKDQDTGVLVGLAIWESEAAKQASIHLAREAVADDPFDEWESVDIEGMNLVEV